MVFMCFVCGLRLLSHVRMLCGLSMATFHKGKEDPWMEGLLIDLMDIMMDRVRMWPLPRGVAVASFCFGGECMHGYFVYFLVLGIGKCILIVVFFVCWFG